MRTRTRYAAMAACLLVSSAIVGCDSGGRTRPPSVTVRVLHAAADRSTLEFLREQRTEAQLDFRQASGGLVFDADQYDFNVRALDPTGTSVELLGSFSRELLPDNDYLITIVEPAGVLAPVIVEKPAFDGSTLEITSVHAAPSLGPMSLYIEPTGTDLSSATPIGTLSFPDAVPSTTRAAGTYRLSLTEPGNAANVLLTSAAFMLAEGQFYGFVILDPAADSRAPITVAALGLETTVLFDESVTAGIKVINAAADALPRDVFVDEDFTAPLFSGVAYLTESADAPLAFGGRKISVTPAGNAAVIEAENTSTYARSRHHTALIAGEPGDMAVAAAADDRRAIAGQARIAFMNGASQHEPLAVFIVPPGTDITNRSSSIVLNAPGISSRIAVPPGDYEVVMRETDTSTEVVREPVTVTEGIYSVLASNGATAGTVDLVLLDDFVD